MEHLDAFTALLDAYLDGELSSEESARVQEHLNTCADCRAYVEAWQALRPAFPTTEEVTIPDGFADGVMEIIRAGKAPQKRRTFRWKPLLAPVAACLLVAAAVQFPGFRHHADLNETATASAGSGTIDTFAASGMPDTAASDAAESAEAAAEDSDSQSLLASASAAPSDRAAAPQLASEDAAPAGSSAEDAAPDEDAEAKSSAAVPFSAAVGSFAVDSVEPDAAETFDVSAMDADSWYDSGNVVFSATVFLTAEQAGTFLDGYDGKPYYEQSVSAASPDYVKIGTGYALEPADFSRVLDEIGYTGSPMQNQTATTELSCIVILDA